MSDQIELNQRRIYLMVIVSAITVFVIVGGVLFLAGLGWLGLVVGAVAAAVATALAYFSSDRVAMGSVQAVPFSGPAAARLTNVLDGLCVAAGIERPPLLVVEDPAINAFAVGRGPHESSVVVTSGLAENLNRVEIEAVMAHVLASVQCHDAAVMTVAATFVGRGLAPLGAVANKVMVHMVPPEQKILADRAGMELTRYPPAMVAALRKIRDHKLVVRGASRATAQLWFEPPMDIGGASTPRLTLDERISALQEL